jgi:O-acetyl-ADP-ribose deacetylase (regulator of RNase III)
MTFEYIDGNIFDSTAVAIVNPVNCVGVMGGGLARQFANRYPEILPYYHTFCATGAFRPGNPFLQTANDGKIIVEFPTKDHFKDPSELEWVVSGMESLVSLLGSDPVIPSCAVPPLGAGLGGLNPQDVLEAILEAIENSPVHWQLYDFE